MKAWLYNRYSVTAALLIPGLVGMALVACTPSSAPATQGPLPEDVTIGVGEDVPMVRPWRDGTINIARNVSLNIYEALVSVTTGGNVVPALASSWDVSPDGKTYTFKLRKGATYINGDPVTVQDVAFAFANSKEPKLIPLGASQQHWLRVNVVDDQTVQYVLDWPDPGFLNALARSIQHSLIPEKYFNSVGGEEGFEKAPVGSGPYKLTDRRIKEGWTFERFDEYWGDKPQIRRAVVKVLPENTTRSAALKVGEIDFALNFPASFVKDLQNTGGFKLIKNATAGTITVRINKLRKTDPVSGAPNPFLDKRVRQAMSHAIDRDAMIDKVLDGMGEKLALLFPGDFGYDPEVRPYSYDPGKAKQLLAQAGYPNGFDATYYGLLGERFPLSQQVGEVVAQYLAAVGIRTKVTNEEYAAWLARTIRNTSEGKPNEMYPLQYGTSYVGGGTGSPYLSWRALGCQDTGINWNCDPDFDKQMEQLKLESDPNKAQALVKQLQRYADDQQWAIVLYRSVVLYGMKDRLQFTPTIQSSYTELRNLHWQ